MIKIHDIGLLIKAHSKASLEVLTNIRVLKAGELNKIRDLSERMKKESEYIEALRDRAYPAEATFTSAFAVNIANRTDSVVFISGDNLINGTQIDISHDWWRTGRMIATVPSVSVVKRETITGVLKNGRPLIFICNDAEVGFIIEHLKKAWLDDESKDLVLNGEIHIIIADYRDDVCRDIPHDDNEFMIEVRKYKYDVPGKIIMREEYKDEVITTHEELPDVIDTSKYQDVDITIVELLSHAHSYKLIFTENYPLTNLVESVIYYSSLMREVVRGKRKFNPYETMIPTDLSGTIRKDK